MMARAGSVGSLLSQTTQTCHITDTVMKGSAVGVILTHGSLGICILRWQCVYKYHLYDDARRSALPTKGQETIILLRLQAAMID